MHFRKGSNQLGLSRGRSTTPADFSLAAPVDPAVAAYHSFASTEALPNNGQELGSTLQPSSSQYLRKFICRDEINSLVTYIIYFVFGGTSSL